MGERRIGDGPVEVLAAEAARAALGEGPPPDLLLFASVSPRQLIPDTSAFVARELGLAGITTWSVHATCLSFLAALGQAAALVHAGQHQRVLVVSAERGSISRNFAEPESAALIGDGAGAAVIEASPPGSKSALLYHRLATFPEGAGLAELRGCGVSRHPNDPATTREDNLFPMDGPALYKLAIRRTMRQVRDCLAAVGLEPGDIDLVVPHQPSGPGVQAIQRFGFAAERVVDIVGTFGNCIAASLPMALAMAHEQGRLRRGDRVLLLGTGAGLGIGTTLLRW